MARTAGLLKNPQTNGLPQKVATKNISMKDSELSESEKLRSLQKIAFPDPREEAFSRGISNQNCLSVENQQLLEKRIQVLDEYTLNDCVPAKVQIQFETAKNLYLYAWFVYRFYLVAERQALTALEYGLRERFDSYIPKIDEHNKRSKYRTRDNRLTLKPLLRFAVNRNLLKNEDFEIWWQRARMNARVRLSNETSQRLLNGEEGPIEIDYGNLEILPEDKSWNYLVVILETTPNTRNLHSHGTSMLHNQVLGSFEKVATILNKIHSPSCDELLAEIAKEKSRPKSK